MRRDRRRPRATRAGGSSSRPAGPGARRAKQKIDHGRRGVAGERRTAANRVDFLGRVGASVDPLTERIYAVLDNLNVHRAPDVLLFSLLHPRWEFVFQPTYAAYLNLIEPWWKALRSLALQGRRFEAWAEIEEAVARATAYWNDHRHPFVWGRRRRHRQPRRLGIAAVPKLTLL